MLFWLNVAADSHGESVARIPRSSLSGPGVFRPEYTAPARNPAGLVTVPFCTSVIRGCNWGVIDSKKGRF